MSKEQFDIEAYISETIKNEIERKKCKRQQIIFEIIRTKFSPYEIKDAFKTFNNFCNFMDRVEEEIKKDSRWYSV